MAVVCLHVAAAQSTFLPAATAPWHDVAQFGLLGVDLFFVLSGYIIMSSHYDDMAAGASRLRGVGRFVSKRLARIFIPYLPIGICYAIAMTLIPRLSESGRPWGLLATLLLLPTELPPALGPAWTLVQELIFYSFFLLFFLRPQVFAVAAMAWAGILILELLTGQLPVPVLEHAPFKQFLLTINLEFLAGVACAWLARAFHGYRKGLTLLGFGLVMLLLGLVTTEPRHESIEAVRLWFGGAFAFVVLGFVWIETSTTLAVPRTLTWLGDISFSLYLVHYPIISVVSRATRKFDGLAGGVAHLAICLGASLLFAAVYYAVLEKRAMRRVQAAWLGWVDRATAR